jgi:hypothetical protein
MIAGSDAPSEDILHSMPKGLHTASAAVLFETPPTAEQLTSALAPFTVLRRLEGSDDPASAWMAGALSFVLSMRRELNGTAAVTRFDAPWPDGMGDPQSDPWLFGAWTFGYFGPFVFPGNLERAAQHAYTWAGAAEAAARHRAFVRINTTYVGGADQDAPCLPEGYDALAELHVVTRAATALLELPGALAYFNPNGEVLLPLDSVRGIVERRAAAGVPPLDLWTNVRMFRFGEIAPWMLMDTVGMEQLGVDDLEACFSGEGYEPGNVAGFLSSVSAYLHARGPVIQHGHTADGPGGLRWRAHRAEALLPRPRSTLRWFPVDGREIPAPLRAGIEPAGESA